MAGLVVAKCLDIFLIVKMLEGTVQLREGLLAALVGEAAERDTGPSCVPVMWIIVIIS